MHGGITIGNVLGQQDADLLGRGPVVFPDKWGKLHIGRVLQYAAFLHSGSRQPLGFACLSETALGDLFRPFGMFAFLGCSLLGILRLPPSQSFVRGRLPPCVPPR